MYRIRQIDAQDDEVLDTLGELHRLTFFDSAPVPEFDQGDWWLALHEAVPVGFAGVVPSTRADNAGYFSRVGVLRRHCDHGLQLRMMRAREAWARAYGWSCVVSDTTDNIASANNFIRAGTASISRNIPGPGRTRSIGGSRSNDRSCFADVIGRGAAEHRS